MSKTKTPDSWADTTLGEIGSTMIGLTYSPSDVAQDGIPVLRSGNIQKGAIDLSDLVRVKKEIKENLIVRPGDILICARNGSKALVGKAAQIKSLPETMTFGAFMAIYRSPFNDYVEKFLNSPLFRKYLDGVGTSTINQITQSNLKSMSIPLPPVKEQKRIVAKVESTEEKLKVVKENILKAERLRGKYRESLLQKAFRGDKKILLGTRHTQSRDLERKPARATEKLPVLPENWVWSELMAVCDLVIDCHNKTPPYKEHGTVLIRTTNFQNDALDLSEVKYIDSDAFKIWAKRGAPKQGDILFTREAPLGKVAMVPDAPRICMGQRMMLIRPNEKIIDRDYLFAVLRSTYVLDYLNTLSIGATVKHARVGDVETLPIPLPSIEDQRLLAKVINQGLATLKNLDSIIYDLKQTVDFGTIQPRINSWT